VRPPTQIAYSSANHTWIKRRFSIMVRFLPFFQDDMKLKGGHDVNCFMKK